MTEKKQALLNYLFSERAKNNLITASKMLALTEGFKGAEKSGAKKLLGIFIESIQSELDEGYAKTSQTEFKNASGLLDNAKQFIEFDDFEKATLEISKAVTECTTPAQNSWQVLSENELV